MQPKNPWQFSIEIGFTKAEHRPAGELTGVEVGISSDTAFELDNRIEGEPFRKPIEGNIRIDHMMTAMEHSYPGFVNGKGEQISNADKMRFQDRVNAWCEANCKGKFRMLVHDVYSQPTYLQFHLESDMRTYLDEFGGNIRQPNRRERSELMSRQEMEEMGERARKGDPEAVAWLKKPISIVGRIPERSRPKRSTRWRH